MNMYGFKKWMVVEIGHEDSTAKMYSHDVPSWIQRNLNTDMYAIGSIRALEGLLEDVIELQRHTKNNNSYISGVEKYISYVKTLNKIEE